MPQNTAIQTRRNCEAQLSEMNARMNNLEKLMESFVTENQKQINELKSAFNARCDSRANEPSAYTIHYTGKNWMDADLSCKAEGKHLVSFETLDEQKHVFELIEQECSLFGFWASARDLGGDNWIWRNSGEVVLTGLWGDGEPSGDGDCGNLHQSFTQYLLNDAPCETKNCYICESP